MILLTLNEIAKAADGELVADAAFYDTRAESIAIDSRKAERGSLFFALPGKKADGHDFLEQAAANGAVCAVVERVPENGCSIPLIKVNNTLRALQALSDNYRRKLFRLTAYFC